MKPNLEQILSLLRAVLQILGTTLVTNGVVHSSADWTTISGAILMIVPVVWGMFAHTDGTALKVVEAMPDVAKIIPKTTAAPSSAVAEAAADPARPKVIENTPAIAAAIAKP